MTANVRILLAATIVACGYSHPARVGDGGTDAPVTCGGTTCVPPSPVCLDASTLREFAASCAAGACAYQPIDTTCAAGCTNGACATTCGTQVCNQIPSPTCIDASTLRTFTAACAMGACAYPHSDTTCAKGCVNGACACVRASFATHVDYATDSRPESAVVADVDGDGKPDLVTVSPSQTAISVLVGHGDGTFAAHVDSVLATAPFAIAVADVNGDGKLDIVTANGNNDTIGVLLGHGDGTFAAEVQYTSGPANSLPNAIAVGDVNGDGKPDVVTANYMSGTFSVLVGHGDGTFTLAVQDACGSYPSAPHSVAVADVNGDGHPDLAIANYNNNAVAIVINRGDGTFDTEIEHATHSGPISVAVVDVNGDGKPDIVTANNGGGGTVSVLIGHGDGTFAAHVDYTTGANNAVSIAADDVNGDGWPDLVTANYESGGMTSVLINHGDGTFAAAVTYATATDPFSVAIADVNGDGTPDLVTANVDASGTVSVLLGTCSQ
jgi:hypothetical protein